MTHRRDDAGTGGAKVKQPKSLSEFVRAKKRATCKVCQLPPGIIEELRMARTKKIPRAIVLEWLEREHGLKITGADLDAHHSGRHENGYPA